MMILVCFMLAASGGNLDRLTKEIAASGQVVGLAATPSERVAPPVEIAPGQPPLLSFRSYEGQQRHRVSNTELMLDDAVPSLADRFNSSADHDLAGLDPVQCVVAGSQPAAGFPLAGQLERAPGK
jgi:hypothetical protein